MKWAASGGVSSGGSLAMGGNEGERLENYGEPSPFIIGGRELELQADLRGILNFG